MDSIGAETAGSALAAELPRIRALLRQQKFTEALEACTALLAGAPEHRDLLLYAAVAERYLGRIPDALQTLARLEHRYPRFSRLHEERGHCFVVMQKAPQAIESFLLAVNINHALPASWSMLEGLYRLTSQKKDAAAASSQVATLRNLPREVVTATGLFADGDLDLAESMIRDHLLKHGDHVEGMRLLARIGIARKILDDAEQLLAAVLKMAPTYRAARQEYAGVLVELHKYSQARREIEQLLEQEPENRVFKTLHAASLIGLGEHEQALGHYRTLLAETPEDADLHLSMAHALKTLGRRKEAVDFYRRAAACRPQFGDAYWSLANLKTYHFTDAELSQMRAAQSAPTTGVVDRYHLCFALGKALEDGGEFSESFRCYEQGNALKRSESNFRSEIIESNTRQQIEVCTRDFFASRRNVGAPDPSPIFIVGLPRSGLTLLEQILASHSQVEGTQELPNIQQIVHRLRGRDLNNPLYPRIVAEMADDDFRGLGEEYLADTCVYRTSKSGGVPNTGRAKAPPPFFIDKMPNNFRHLGLIRLILPNAKIIDARREPMACCFSNLKQLFANGQEFTYSIDDIARYYRTYLELMRHWDRVLPGWILRVHHENVVDDIEGNVRRILDFCGLEFERQCIDFHKTERSVRTASSEQVRQPLYRDGLGQWKHFEPWLEPLRIALGEALDRYRDA